MGFEKIYGICFIVAGGSFLLRGLFDSGKSKKFYWVGVGFIVVGIALILNLVRLH